MTPAHAFYSPLAAEVGGSLNWLYFAAGHVLAGFETVTPSSAVADLWRLASRPEATVESVVAAIPTRGPEAVESFAVVFLGDPVTVVLRGSGSVDVLTEQGQRRIDSRGMQPWYLAEFAGVLGGSLGSDRRPMGVVTEPAGSDLPVESGLVRAPWLAWTGGRIAELATGAPSSSTPATGPLRSRGAGGSRDAGHASGPEPHHASRPITGSIPVQKLAAAPGFRGSPITTPIPVIPAAPSRDAGEGADGDSGLGADLEDTIHGVGTGRWSLLEEAERGDALAAASEAAGAGIEDTIVTDRQRHRADVPPLAAWSPGRIELDPRFRAGASAAAAHCGFKIGDGPAYVLDTPVYIGRKPSSPRIVTGTVPRLLKVPSPSMEVSGTHIELRQEGANVVVTDMRSTNGTFVAQPGAAHVKLRQGESLVVAPGTLVDIGDGNVIEILPIR
ncbi:MAG: FHA domain-containing protein [Naasia sp.]